MGKKDDNDEQTKTDIIINSDSYEKHNLHIFLYTHFWWHYCVALFEKSRKLRKIATDLELKHGDLDF